MQGLIGFFAVYKNNISTECICLGELKIVYKYGYNIRLFTEIQGKSVWYFMDATTRP